jgi:hypothetical protein
MRWAPRMSAPFDSLTFSSLRRSKHRPSRAKWRAEWCRPDERSGARQVLDGAPPARLEWRSIGWVGGDARGATLSIAVRRVDHPAGAWPAPVPGGIGLPNRPLVSWLFS